MLERVSTFEEKIEEYFLSCHPNLLKREDRSFLSEWPLYKFSIVRLIKSLGSQLDEQLLNNVADKLIDIKLHYCYLLTIEEHFHRGATLIVGNNELEKLNPRTISLLRATHYRVYLLAVLIEQTLDLLWLIVDGKAANFKRGKWNKIIQRVQAETCQAVLSDEDSGLLLTFKEQFRTAELHKFSMVRGFTGKDKWNHLQVEEQAAGRVLKQLYEHYVSS